MPGETRSTLRERLVDLVGHWLVIEVNPVFVGYKLQKPLPSEFLLARGSECATEPFWARNERALTVIECLQYRKSGRDYRAAPRLLHWKERIASGRHRSTKGERIDTPEKAERVVEHYMKVFEDMFAHGYDRTIRQPWIGVAIGPRGELFKARNGRHRLAAAQLARISPIPVAVKHVHRDWLERCRDRHGGVFPFTLMRGLRELSLGYNREPTAAEWSALPIPRIDPDSYAWTCWPERLAVAERRTTATNPRAGET